MKTEIVSDMFGTGSAPCLALTILLLYMPFAFGAVAFEKLTNMAYNGNSYYTIRNLTLYECQGWCREEPECKSASFSFVSRGLEPVQETLCLLQNETAASDPTTVASRSESTYYMVKLNLRSDKVCNRPWTFERVPNRMMRGMDNALIFTSTKEACLAACLNEERFTCRSVEYNYITLQCHLSEFDRRSAEETTVLIEASGIDYFENLCLSGENACRGSRRYAEPKFASVSRRQVNNYVEAKYYVDLELMANNEEACRRACEIENEILCRSYLFRGPPTGSTYNCQLFHLDHVTLPDGENTFAVASTSSSPPVGDYYENICIGPKGGGEIQTPSGFTNPSNTVPDEVASPDSQKDEPSDGVYIPETASGSLGGAGYPPASQPSGLLSPGAPGTPSSGLANPGTTSTSTPDINCDSTGTCYDVSVQCRDTRITVLVSSTKPFNGRIYALGRSQTCNVDVSHSSKFRLDLSLTGQDCNTQTIGSVYTNTVVLQHHSKVMTKTDKVYKVRCTYDMSSRNVSFGMMPIRDPDMISVTSAPEAPPPKIRILDATGNEVETVKIGDSLRFVIEIPPTTPYAIFARNCVAMAKDAQSTFQIIDERGCPVDPAIFPRFTSSRNVLQSTYEAFRFTESYGVIFQCNVKYCLGECPPVDCEYNKRTFQSWGRRRRSVTKTGGQLDPDSTTLSREIIVLDFGDHLPQQSQSAQRTDISAELPTYTTIDEETRYSVNSLNDDFCPSRSSVLMLALACAVMLAIYLITIAAVIFKRCMTHGGSKSL